MKKRKITSLLAFALCMLLVFCACGEKETRYPCGDYVLDLEYKPDFKVLQLTDVHLGDKDNRKLHYDFMDLTINEAEPDLIAVSGDVFTFAGKKLAMEFFDYMDSHGIPWTLCFGNHDEQCYFSVDWMTDTLNNYGSYCKFKDIQDDDVFGNSNFAIDLRSGGKTVWQIIMMDSNRYNFGEYTGYDYIKQDQIDWYERLVENTAEEAGKTVPSMMFFHIPLPEYDNAWNAVKAGGSTAMTGEKREHTAAPKKNSGLFDKITELGSTKAVSVGHDHQNSLATEYRGVALCYGVTSTDRIYYDEDCMGGTLFTLHDDETFDVELIFHTYDELNEKEAK